MMTATSGIDGESTITAATIPFGAQIAGKTLMFSPKPTKRYTIGIAPAQRDNRTRKNPARNYP
jgi:hypothetical protein